MSDGSNNSFLAQLEKRVHSECMKLFQEIRREFGGAF